MVSRGRAAAYRQTHARILLLSDEAQGDGVMKDGDWSLQVGRATVERVRRRCVEEGVEAWDESHRLGGTMIAGTTQAPYICRAPVLLTPGRWPAAEFVCAMEDVLEVYHRPYATKCWCAWTRPAQQVSETRQPPRRGLGRPGP